MDYGGLGGRARQGRQKVGRSDAYCITLPTCFALFLVFSIFLGMLAADILKDPTKDALALEC